MKRALLRIVPALVVGLLLVLAALGPSRRAGARSARASATVATPPCAYLVQWGGGRDTLRLGSSAGTTQPVDFVGNVAACSLTILPVYSTGRLDYVLWDPLTLAPDPTTVALRTRSFTTSEMYYGPPRATFSPPVVIRRLTNVAEPPRTTTAMDYLVTYPWNIQPLYYDSVGAAGTPAALQRPPGAPRAPLPGPHPVLSHAVCAGEAATQDLYVVQSVMTTSALMDISSYELIQRFRVPVQARVHWAELAFGPQTEYPLENGLIAIMDLEGALTPPAGLPPSLVEGSFYQYLWNYSTWASHSDFASQILLEPNRDYWLLARVVHGYPVYARYLTGGESANFTASIGPLFQRADPTGPWSPVPGKALCFRLIGEPLDVLDAPGREPPRSSLRLRAAPNPARGAAFLIWSGASGPIRFEVLDARGRRVGGGAGGAGFEGRWTWHGARDDGRPLPAGVYFVRATDGAGRVAVERLVLVR